MHAYRPDFTISSIQGLVCALLCVCTILYGKRHLFRCTLCGYIWSLQDVQFAMHGTTVEVRLVSHSLSPTALAPEPYICRPGPTLGTAGELELGTSCHNGSWGKTACGQLSDIAPIPGPEQVFIYTLSIGQPMCPIHAICRKEGLFLTIFIQEHSSTLIHRRFFSYILSTNIDIIVQNRTKSYIFICKISVS